MDEAIRFKVCEVCSSWIKATLLPTTNIHWARLDCPKCGFKGFAPNPNNPRNNGTKLLRQGNRLTVEKIMAFHNFNEPFCFMCLRKVKELGVREVLTADHIKELNSCDGEEELDNVKNGQILCSACHKMKLWLTTYLNNHIKEKNDTSTTTATGN